MDPADARNILGNEIKKWTEGSAGLEESQQPMVGERPPGDSLPVVSDDDFDLPGQVKTLPDKTTLWKVNIIKFPIVGGQFTFLFVLVPSSSQNTAQRYISSCQENVRQ